MRPNRYQTACCAAAILVSSSVWSDERVDGKSAYQSFNCAGCHGDDAKSPSKAGVPKIAGLDRVYLTDKTNQMVEKMAHKDVVGTCGEVPTKAQIGAIADWVSRQPK